MRQRGQLERQRQPACTSGCSETKSPTQRAGGQNRHRERPVFAVAPDNRGNKFFRLDSACRLAQPSLRSSDDGTMVFIEDGGDAKRRPAGRRGADVTDAENSVAPTAVGIDMAREPVQTAPGPDCN